MKKNFLKINSLFLLLCICVALLPSAQAQLPEPKVLIIGTTEVERDTVIIGYQFEADLKIDPELGEVNIIDIPPSGVIDMRIQQRDEAHFDCLFSNPNNVNSTPVFYNSSENFDSKINMRCCPAVGKEFVFEIKPNSDTLKQLILQSDFDLRELIYRIYYTFDSCHLSQSYVAVEGPDPVYEYILDLDTSIYNITIGCELIYVRTEEYSTEDSIILFPNPADEATTIVLPKSLSKNGEWRLYNAFGQMVKTYIIPPGKYEYHLTLDDISSSLYFYSFAVGKEVISSGKFVKK